MNFLDLCNEVLYGPPTRDTSFCELTVTKMVTIRNAKLYSVKLKVAVSDGK